MKEIEVQGKVEEILNGSDLPSEAKLKAVLKAINLQEERVKRGEILPNTGLRRSNVLLRVIPGLCEDLLKK